MILTLGHSKEVFQRNFMDLENNSRSRALVSSQVIHSLNYRSPIWYILIFIQIDFWKPDSVTQIKPHSTVDFRVAAEDADAVEDFLNQNELQYE